MNETGARSSRGVRGRLHLCVYTSCVWEEIGDVLHGLGEDRGWTSKPDEVWEEIGDGLH